LEGQGKEAGASVSPVALEMNTEERILGELKKLIQDEQALRIRLFKERAMPATEKGLLLKQLNEIELQKKVKGQTLFRMGVSQIRIRSILFGD